MYPAGTENVYSYFEARKGAKYNKTLFFGLQYYLKEYLQGVVVTKEKIDFAERLSKAHFGTTSTFNRAMWDHIVAKHGGKLPVLIKAVPEGMLVDVSNVMMTIEVTDPVCYQLTNHLETMLSKIWYTCTVATRSYELRKMIKDYMEWTCDDMSLLDFSLHDFGYRGTSSEESAGIGGAAHLVNFLGTDTVKAMCVAMDYYDASMDCLAYSVPATEHSIMTSLGREGEVELLGSLLDKYPEGILSLVIDSYNYKNFVEIAGTVFKDKIMNRKGKVVFRPDSGDPISVTIDVVEGLAKNFGYTTNSKGFKQLPGYVGVLWGDGIDYEGVRNILYTLRNCGWATNNIIFGMGGNLLQRLDRDTQRFAFKSSAQLRNGVWHDIFKNPLDSSKNSKKGRLALIRHNGKLETVQEKESYGLDVNGEEIVDLLQTVFENGEIVKQYTFAEVRQNAKR
jgi:nicotinamide phosphoribosyltransferase